MLAASNPIRSERDFGGLTPVAPERVESPVSEEATMATGYKNCQSCGMPMTRDANGGGTNADGSRSTRKA